MAIYGQSWRQPFGAQFSGNMSFRNPMAKAAMNNNPMGNQQTLKPNLMNAVKPTSDPYDGVVAKQEATRVLGALQQPVIKTANQAVAGIQNAMGNALSATSAYLKSPATQPLQPQQSTVAVQTPVQRPVLPANQGVNPAIPSFDPQTPSPLGQALGPQSMQSQGVIQNPALSAQAFGLERARQYQANRQATPAAPQYINPEFRAGQANMQRLNQSMAQTLNRPLQRRADAIAGVQPGPMINPNAARNVLMGQSPDADLSMRPMTIPGMKFDPQQNAMVQSSPYEARGIQPGSLRQDPVMAFEKFDNPDDFRVATGGMAMIPPPAARSVKPEYVQNSLDNARIARAARMRGVTASGIDQWRAQSPYAQGILKQSPARLAALRERMQPAAAPVAPEVQPAALETPAIAPPPVQNTGMNNLVPETSQVQPVAPQVQAGVPQVQPDAQIPVDPKRLKAATPYSSRIYPGMPRGEIQFKPTPNAFSSALRAFSGYQGN